MSGPEPAGSRSRLGAWGLVGLLIASLALGILVFRARTPDLALEVTSYPNELREIGLTEIEFFVRFDDPAAKVELVGRNQVVVRTLASSIPLEAGQEVVCSWDGLDDDGEKAPPGRYRLRVTLPSEGREMVFPRRLEVEAGDRRPARAVPGEPCVAGVGE